LPEPLVEQRTRDRDLPGELEDRPLAFRLGVQPGEGGRQDGVAQRASSGSRVDIAYSVAVTESA
jgi:hypothetical protein